MDITTENQEEIQGLTQEYENLKTEISALSDEYTKFTSVLSANRSEAEENEKSLTGTQQRIVLVFDKTIEASLKLASVFEEPIAVADEFGQAMKGVQESTEFGVAGQFDALQGHLLNLSSVIPVSSVALAELADTSADLGIAAGDLGGFTEAAARIGVGFSISGEQAAEALFQLGGGISLNKEEAIALADTYSRVSDGLQVQAGTLLQTSAQIGELNNGLSISRDDAAALSAAFLATGSTSGGAVAGVRTLLNTLGDLNNAGPEAQAVLTAMGTDAEAFSTRLRTDTSGAVTDFLATLRETGNADQLAGTIFKEQGENISLLANGLDKYQTALTSASDATGRGITTSDLYRQETADLGSLFSVLENNVTNVGIRIGTVMQPAIENISGAFSAAGSMVTDTAEVIGTVTNTIETSREVFGTFRNVIGRTRTLLAGFNLTAATTRIRMIGLAAGGAIARFGALLMSIGTQAIPVAIGAMRALTIAVMTNPIGLVIGGIALVAGYLISQWEPVSAFFGRLWSGIQAGAEFVAGIVGNIFGGFFGEIAGYLLGQWEPVAEFFNNLWGSIQAGAEAIAGIAGGIFGRFFGDDEDEESESDNVIPFPGQAVRRTNERSASEIRSLKGKGSVSSLSASSASLSGSGTQNITNHFNISVQQKSGESTESLARRIAEMIEMKQRGFGRPEAIYG